MRQVGQSKFILYICQYNHKAKLTKNKKHNQIKKGSDTNDTTI